MIDLYKYENSLDKDIKKKMGITYTPQKIVHFINERCLSMWKKKHPPKVLDFSSGTGVFLVDMAKKISERYTIDLSIVYDEYIFANDLDQAATSIFAGHTGCPNITSTDGLEYDLSSYDIIVGNPPYVKIQNLSPESQKSIRRFSWCGSGNTDLYIAFSEMICKSGKIFGFICPNSWQRSNTGETMKEWFLNSKIVSNLIDFRSKKVFNEAAYTSILISNSKQRKTYRFQTDTTTPAEIKKYNICNQNNFFLKKSEVEFIENIQKKTTVLFDKCSLRVGIATLSDGVYFLKDCKIEGDYIISGSEKIEKDIVKNCYKASKLVRYDEDIADGILYPYDANTNIISEAVMRKKYPFAYKYLQKHKAVLMKRDNGKFKMKCDSGNAVWYEYGRNQGLELKNKKILISPILCKKYFLAIDDGLFTSGYCLELKRSEDYNSVLKAIQTDEFKKWVHLFGSPKSGGYYSLNKSTLKNYKF